MSESDSSPFSSNDLYDLAREQGQSTHQPSGSVLETSRERYRKVEDIATGGMKCITRVYDQFICRDIAMAQLRNSADEYTALQFLNEARLTAQLDHPNIIKVHDMGTDPDGQLFFTMDLKTGQSLGDTLAKRDTSQSPTPINTTIDIFAKVCEAIAYAHSKDIVHLDLKPDNIQYGAFGEVVVCDWGLGTSLKRLSLDDIQDNAFYGHLISSKPANERINGTPGYMAPEQYQLNSAKDKRSDIYGLGALLYTLLSGHPPLSGSLKEIRNKAEAGDIPPLSPNTVPESLESICSKAMAVAPDERYASVSEILEDLRLFQTGYTTSAENSGFYKELKRFLRRNARLCSVIGISLGILILCTSLFIAYQAESRKQEHRSRLRAEQSEQKAKQALQLYEQEKQALTSLSQDFSSSLHEMKIMQNETQFFHSPSREVVEENIATVDQILARTPDDLDALQHKACMYFILHEFVNAEKLLSPFDERKIRDLYRVSVELNADPIVTENASSTEAFARILRAMRHNPRPRKHLIKRMFTYDTATRDDFDGYEAVVHEVLRYYNPEWDPIEFTYDSESQHLQVGGSNISTFTFDQHLDPQSFLAVLNLKSLDLSNTDFFSFSHLGGLSGLTTLDISGTLIASIPTPEQFPRLKQLHVAVDQYSETDSQQLSTWVEVIVVD